MGVLSVLLLIIICKFKMSTNIPSDLRCCWFDDGKDSWSVNNLASVVPVVLFLKDLWGPNPVRALGCKNTRSRFPA